MFTPLRRAILRFYESTLQRRKTFRYFAALEASQWLPRAELERRQLESLRCLLSHVYQHSPFCRREWDRLGLDPARVDSFANFERWPVMTKEVIRANRPDLRIPVPGQRMLSKATGGSSGVPFGFDLNMESHERRVAATYRGYNWAGAGPGTRQFYLWGIPLGQRTWRQRMKDRLFDWVNHRHTANSFELSRERVPDFLQRLNRYRPEVIVAYTNPLYAFARAIEEAKGVPFSPKSIVVGAEKLHPFQRELVERVFRAPVFETYGAREVMLIGAECDRHTGLHLTTENHVVEVLDDHGRPTPFGEEGNVVITDLTNYGLPFVRYANGDRAVAGFTECSCGRGLPMLQKVVGRTLDLIQTPDGRTVPGEFFPHLFKDYSAIERFQVVQPSLALVEVRAVLRPGWTKEDEGRLLGELRQTLGPEVRVEWAPVDNIPLTRTGKLQVVVSRLPRPA